MSKSHKDSGENTIVQQLIDAAKRGDSEYILKQHKIGVDLASVEDVGGNSLLHVAAEHGHLALVELLGNKLLPELLDAVNVFERTAVSLAAEKGHKDIVDYFIEKDSKLLRIVDAAYVGPYSYAMMTGHEDIAGAMLESEPSVFKDHLIRQFHTPYGNTDEEGMLVAIAEKTARKEVKGDFFKGVVVSPTDFEDFILAIKRLTDNGCVLPGNIQFGLDTGITKHWISGDVQLLPDGNIDLCFVDSLAETKFVKSFAEITRKHFPDAVIRLNYDKLQANVAPNCAIISLDAMFHFSNMNDFLAPDFKDVRKYMDAHTATMEDVNGIKSESVRKILETSLKEAEAQGIKVGKLPLRMIRTMESLSRILSRIAEEQQEALLPVKHRARDRSDKNPENMLQSVALDTKEESPNLSINTRINYVFSKMQQHLEQFMDGKTAYELVALMQKHTVAGFTEWVKEVEEKAKTTQSNTIASKVSNTKNTSEQYL